MYYRWVGLLLLKCWKYCSSENCIIQNDYRQMDIAYSYVQVFRCHYSKRGNISVWFFPTIYNFISFCKSCGVNEKCTEIYNCPTYINPVDNNEPSTCEGFMEVCCKIPNKDYQWNDPENQPIATQCGVARRNGVGIKKNTKLDQKAKFGKFEHIIIQSYVIINVIL